MSDDVRQEEDIGAEYASSLADLTVNSKPLINMLTMLAEDHVDSAAEIVTVIEKHLAQVKPEMKLPVLYLVDSIVKNIGDAYTSLFTQNIVATFCSVFEKVEESTRASMFKLRQTWSDVFPTKKLYALDVRVKSIDPAWPITAPPPIHVNPAFISKPGSSAPATKPAKAAAPPVLAPVAPVADLCETKMRDSLLKKQKELLELQQKKLEIELLQTKARLQQQQIQMIQTTQQDMLTDVVPLSADILAVDPRVQKEETHSMFSAVSSTCTLSGDLAHLDEIVEVAMVKTEDRHAVLKEENATTKLGSPKRGSSKSPDKKLSLDVSGSPGAHKVKEEKKEKESRKKMRKDADKEKKERGDRFRKGKEQSMQSASDQVEADVEGKPRNMRDVAKAMPRIPKISERNPVGTRDPRLQNQVGAGVNEGEFFGADTTAGSVVGGGGGGGLCKMNSTLSKEDDVQVLASFRSSRNNSSRPRKRPHSPGIQAERRKLETKKDNVDPKKRKTNRFDDLFGNEDIDYRKVAAPALVAPVPPNRDSPPPGRGVGWAGPPTKRPLLPSRGRGGMWPGRGRGRGPPIRDDAPWRDGEDSWEGMNEDGGGSPRNMDFILEQAKENHRNGVINDGEYSTIIRQVFQMSESKMIREVQRRDSGPTFPRDRDFRYPPGSGPGSGPYPEPMPGPGPMPERHMWNDSMGRDPRLGGYPPFENRHPRYDHSAPRGPLMPAGPPRPMASGLSTAFEVRPNDDMRTIPIDNIPREIRFYDDKAVILMAADDPRLLGFEPGIRSVFIDNMTIDCPVDGDYVDFLLDGQIHKVKIGAPTRELYIDGKWYECMFGAPPITVHIGNRPVQVALTHNTPSVKIGTERRLDLLAGRVTMIIDAHSVVPVYLDLKLQHFEMEGSIYTLQFKDSLRTVVIDSYPYRVDFGGLPMAIQLNGKNHFVRFSSLPRGVEPGKVLLPLQNVDETSKTDEALKRTDTPPVNFNIGELLSKLVATGLLPGTEPESTRQTPKEEVKEEKMKVVNLLDAESMKSRPNAIISVLYSGMQCGSCGLRFPADQTQRYSSHLDWHFRQNRRDKGAANKPKSRKWYCNKADWVQFEETETADSKRLNWFETIKEKEMDNERNSDDMTAEEHTSVPVGSSDVENKCFICHEDLDQFFHEESEEWHLKDAVRYEGITYHRLCYRDYLTTGDVGNYPLLDSVEQDQQHSGNDEEPAAETATESVKDEGIYIKSDTDESEEDTAPDSPDKDVNGVEEVPKEPQTNGCILSETLQIPDSGIAELVGELSAKDSEATEEPAFRLTTEDIEMVEEPGIKSTSEDVEMVDTATPFEENFKSEVETTFISELIEENDIPTTFKSETPETDKIQSAFKPEVATPFESEIAASDLNEILTTNFLLSDPNELIQDVAAEFPENPDEKMVDDADSMETGTELVALKKQVDAEDITASVSVDNKDGEMKNDLVEEPMDVLEELLDLPDSMPVDIKPAMSVEKETIAVDTSIVSNSIDGNLELSAKTTRTAAPSGVKIKINLFKKGPAAVATSVSEDHQNAKSQVNTTPSGGGGVGSPLSQFLDESSLTDKPRLIGRKLTVLPPMNKGVETSGLCCIM